MIVQPTQAGFLSFVRDAMRIPVLALPDDSVYLTMSYCAAVEEVYGLLRAVGGSAYAMAVYNLAGDALVNVAIDEPGRSFFSELQDRLGINAFVPGVLASSSNAGTSSSQLSPEFMKTFMMANLQQLKTPWGRAYLALAQRTGTLWGVS